MTAMERIEELEKRLQELSDRIVLLEAKDARRMEWAIYHPVYDNRTYPLTEADHS